MNLISVALESTYTNIEFAIEKTQEMLSQMKASGDSTVEEAQELYGILIQWKLCPLRFLPVVIREFDPNKKFFARDAKTDLGDMIIEDLVHGKFEHSNVTGAPYTTKLHSRRLAWQLDIVGIDSNYKSIPQSILPHSGIYTTGVLLPSQYNYFKRLVCRRSYAHLEVEQNREILTNGWDLTYLPEISDAQIAAFQINQIVPAHTFMSKLNYTQFERYVNRLLEKEFKYIEKNQEARTPYLSGNLLLKRISY
jgi:hypothetical protein